jgi:uncharacterized membrane protein YeaQ/YmgE (transglycosylase-associated protein family)
MGSLGAAPQIALLVVAAVAGAILGLIASHFVRGNKRRMRMLIVLGFTCGLIAGTILRRRRRAAGHFRFATLISGLWPPQWRHQLRW